MDERTVQMDGEQVRKRRIGKGWPQEGLAGKAKLSKRTVEAIEQNGHRFLLDTARKIAEALQSDLSSLLVPDEVPPWFDGGGEPPYFAHFYPLPAHFTGRCNERTMLTEWCANPSAPPVFVLEAIGGMGKSALAWKWVSNDLLPGSSKPDGVFWWSFYESNATFRHFVKRAIAYVGGGEYQPDLSLGRPWWHLVNLLRERRYLLVLDGVERLLRAYEGKDAVNQDDSVETDPDGRFRECIEPEMQDFLIALLAPHGYAKVLLSSRLTPKELDDKAGWQRHALAPMTEEEAVAYFRARGITEAKATRAEIEFTCDRYGYHPLALTLLSGAALKDPHFMGDIRSIEHAEPRLIPNEKRRTHHVLELAYNALVPKLRQFVSQLAAFRFGFDYPAVEHIFCGQINDLSGTLIELEERGFLRRNEAQRRFDMHPVVRKYAYDYGLTQLTR